MVKKKSKPEVFEVEQSDFAMFTSNEERNESKKIPEESISKVIEEVTEEDSKKKAK